MPARKEDGFAIDNGFFPTGCFANAAAATVVDELRGKVGLLTSSLFRNTDFNLIGCNFTSPHIV